MVSLNPAFFYNLVYEWVVGLVTLSVIGAFMAKAIWTSLTIILLIALVIVNKKRADLDRAEDKALTEAIRQTAAGRGESTNHIWEKIIGYLNSENQADWKLAILEADTILDSLVQKMGYRGENLGERLKQVESSDFLTLNDAWEAHKIRNAIAHEAGYDLSHREAKRVLKLFENVFKEFEYI
jgi:hypothetical protein